MKKSILVLGLMASLAMLVGCASTDVESSQTFKVSESIDGNTYFYYLKKAPAEYKACVNHDIFYVISPKKVGNMYYTPCKEKVEKMLNDGNFSIYENDWLGYTPILLTEYPNKEEEEGFAFGNDDNPLEETDLDSIYVIKPYYYEGVSNLIKNGPYYTIQVIDKSTGDVVKTFDNVVTNWQGMSGWYGMVVSEDYTFITKDKKQYIVKGNKYSIKKVE